MPVTPAVQTNYLYRVEYASNVARWTNQADAQVLNGEIYEVIKAGIEHSRPRFSGDAQAGEIDLSIHEDNVLTALFSLGPPPFRIRLLIYEYDRDAETAELRYRGWIIRPSFDLDGSTVSFRCKTVYHFYERESFTDSLSALSRYSIFDPRSGVDIEGLRETVTVSDFNDLRDVITVTGLAQAPPYYRGGLIIAPDRDMRTIIEHELDGSDTLLTLSSAFNRFTLDEGFTTDVYPGDDLLYDTWANKFASVTNNGELHGGWPFMPNVDPAVRGVI
jgi:hypothetical protein